MGCTRVRAPAGGLAEISLEELAFVLLTRALHCAGVSEDNLGVDTSDVFESALSSRDSGAWSSSCAAAAQALRHIALSTWRPMECHSVARELEAWCAAGGGSPVATTEDALRMRASLERAQRLVRAHTAALTEGYGGVPNTLGAAFNVPTTVSASFVITTVRASVPYQLSRLLTPMLRAASRAAAAAAAADAAAAGGVGGFGGFGVGGMGLGDYGGDGGAAPSKSIVVGRGVGRLVECARLEPGAAGKAKDGPVVAFVWRAEGDEEVTAAGRHVKAGFLWEFYTLYAHIFFFPSFFPLLIGFDPLA